ncbi:hypothetical protein L202_01691 [Cryptococcus amylolentus CBS 6039]|uniref:Uncharacterized protein n=1 Tax=Cryptococcus amylolentus CBS 6039 TaxID=1295533 RepID=A0A1E3I6X4_9TREE|nr:hypothetical protein L202_01691 [Cryptococcus amylolentus CBS 6039]ODN83576.1 hypothetical protein L202_01691 [Cryptococcus amylolentus CBS 6039]
MFLSRQLSPASSLASRSFCSTCRLLQAPKRLGESSIQPLRTRSSDGTSSAIDASSERRPRTPKRDRQVDKSKSHARQSDSSEPKLRREKLLLLGPSIDSGPLRPKRPIPDGSSRTQRSPRAPDGSAPRVHRDRDSRPPRSNAGPSWESIAREKGIRFIGIDLGTALPRIFTSRPTMQYITPLFAIRLFPASALPLRPAPPFPLHAIARKRQEMKAEAACVYAVVIASKAKVSKLAVERNKVRRKIMEAMRTVVNAPGMVGKNLVSPEHAYIISANPEVYDAPMEMLVNDVERSLVTIRKKMEKAGDVKSGAELWLPEPRYLSKEGRRW